MRDDSYNPVISPDGRFEVFGEKDYDRGDYNYFTVLIERATGERLFAWPGDYCAEFAEDGLLTIHFPSFKYGAQIDPVKLVFRARSSDPWVPLVSIWMVDSAYRMGYEEGRKNKDRISFPWEMSMWLLGSIVALPALGWEILSSSESVASAVTILFGLALMIGALAYITIHYLRDWMKERNRK